MKMKILSHILRILQEDDSGTTTPSSTHSRTPVPGHVSSLRLPSNTVRKINSNVKDASNKHLDPRTGHIQQGPSQMGFASSNNVYEESSPIESSSKNTYTTSRPENSTNHSFKGKKLVGANGRSTMSPSRLQNEASASSQHLTYQSNNENYPLNPIMDSGYGSLDKLKMDGNSQMRSPVLTRRLSNKITRQTIAPKPNDSFDSDDGGSDERGSSGFVNTIGASSTMKDTAYDYIRIKK